MERAQPDSTNFALLRNHFQGQFHKYFDTVRPSTLNLNQIKGDKTVYIDEKLLKQLSFILGDTPKSVAQTLPLHQRSPELAF